MVTLKNVLPNWEARFVSRTPSRSADSYAVPAGAACRFRAVPILLGSTASSIRAKGLIGFPALEIGLARQPLLTGGGRTIGERGDQRIHG